MSRCRACRPNGNEHPSAGQLTEVVLRIAAASDSREALEHFACELMPLVTAGPPGTTGYAAGRPRIHPVFRYWPCLIACERVQPQRARSPAFRRNAGSKLPVRG